MEIAELVARAEGSDCAAIDDTGRVLTYDGLREAAGQLVTRLGPTPRLVLVEGGNTIDWLIVYVGCLIGRHPVLVAPAGNSAAMDHLAAAFAPGWRLSAASDYTPEPMNTKPATRPHPDLALLLSTSGSTGSAKCVRLSHRNIAANAASIAEYLSLCSSERGLVSLPTHYSYGLSIVNSHLQVGATLLLTRRSVTDAEFWSFAADHGATSFAGVPHSYDLLERIDFAARAPSTLRYFTQAGGRLSPRLALHFASIAAERDWRFFVMYGQTEATARMAYMPPALIAGYPECIGRAIPGGRFSLVDANGATIDAPDTDGELVYEGANVMMGYATVPEDLTLAPGPERLPTGDIARRRADGLYQITGRLSRFIKIFGNRIGLDDVERLLAADGYEAIATGIDDRLLVVTRALGTGPALLDLLLRRLKLPADYVEIREVADYPLLASGKIDYAGLKATLAPPTATTTGGGGVVETFFATFGEAGRDEDASFRALGGDSLSYVVTALALERSIPCLPEDWESLSIGALVKMAQEQAATPQAPGTGARMLGKIDTVRGFACLLIVAFHFVGQSTDDGMRLAPDSVWHYVMNSFAMIRLPLFTALAGYLYGAMPATRDGFGPFIARKCKQLLIPMVFATIVYLALRHASDGRDENIVWAFLGGYRHLWFLETLVTIFAIVGATDVWTGADRRALPALLVTPAILCLVLPPIDIAHFSNTLFMMPFFVWGLVLYRRPEMLASGTVLAVATVVLAATLILQQFSMNGIGLEANWNILRAPTTLSVAALLPWLCGCAAIVTLLHAFPKIVPLERIAAYSFAIYLWHPLANNLMQAVMRHAGLHVDVLVFVIGVTGGALLPVALQKSMVRFPRLSLPVVGR